MKFIVSTLYYASACAVGLFELVIGLACLYSLFVSLYLAFAFVNMFNG